jgi:hypothetical protein
VDTTNDQKVVRIPISVDRRWRNMIGPGCVPCVITGRWQRFPNHSGAYLRERECMIVEVMTGTPDEPRKLCDLTVTREDLLRAINSVAPPKKRR